MFSGMHSLRTKCTLRLHDRHWVPGRLGVPERERYQCKNHDRHKQLKDRSTGLHHIDCLGGGHNVMKYKFRGSDCVIK
eukprot:4520542-Amphidinium_carterae.1